MRHAILFALSLLLSPGLFGCPESTSSRQPDTWSPDGGADTDAGGPIDVAEADAGDSLDVTEPDAAHANDVSHDDLGGQEITTQPQAWIYPGSPIHSSEPELVTLEGLSDDGTLHGTHARVWQCAQDEAQGEQLVLDLWGTPMPATLCVPVAAHVDDPSTISPPADPGDLTDDYAAVATYYALQLAHEFFTASHDWERPQPGPIDALVNLQALLSQCSQWDGIPAAYWLGGGFLNELGGLPLWDGPVVALGQIGDVDLAHFLPTTVHEYGHAVMSGTLDRAALAPWGIAHAGLALGEGLADYFASAATGQPLHADFGLGPGETLDYAPCGTPIGTLFTPASARDLREQLSCPASLTGHMYGDGHIFAAALWALREQLGEPFDAVVVAAARSLGHAPALELATAAVIDAAAVELDAAGTAAVEELLAERGLVDCTHAVPPAQIGERGLDMTLSPWLGLVDAIGHTQPAPLQLIVEVSAEHTALELELELRSPSSKPVLDLLLRRDTPIEFQPGVTGIEHDAELVVPLSVGATGVARATVTAPCLQAGSWYLSLLARDAGVRVSGASAALSTEAISQPVPASCAPPTMLGVGATCWDDGDHGLVEPSPGEEGHHAAARLTPPSWPFTVEAVGYHLGSQGACANGLAHSVGIFVGSDTPAAAPQLAETFMVSAAPPVGGWKLRRLVLPEPIELAEGEHLYVSIEMAGDAQGHLCVGMCNLGDTAGAAWWSNAVDEPFSWAELSDFGIDGDLMVMAFGR